MIRKYIILIISLVLLGITYLKSQTITKGNLREEKIRVNPAYAQGGTSSSIFDRVTFIPLETTKESLFGEIWKMEVTEDYFIISDRSTNSILLFQKNGKYYSKIDGRVLGGKIDINFTVDHEQKLIIVRIFSAPNKLVWFDYKGRVVKQVKPPEPFRSVACLNSMTILYSPDVFSNNAVKEDSINYLVKYFRSSDIVQNLLPFNVKKYAPEMKSIMTTMVRPYYFYSSGIKNNIIFVGNNDYSLIVLNDSGITKKYNLIFPEELSLPTDFLQNDLYSGSDKKQEYLKKNAKKISSLRNVYLAGDYLFFETLNGGFLGRDRYLAYNLKKGNLISLDRVSSDSSSFFLPLIGGFVGSIAGSDDKCIYSTIPSLELFQAMESNKDRHPNYPPVLDRYFKNENTKSNPVMVLLEVKDSL